MDLKSHLESILDQGQIGDWFVLYQLSKNSNYYFYREFIRDLAKDLKQKPKQSLSSASGKRNRESLWMRLKYYYFRQGNPESAGPTNSQQQGAVNAEPCPELSRQESIRPVPTDWEQPQDEHAEQQLTAATSSL